MHFKYHSLVFETLKNPKIKVSMSELDFLGYLKL